MQRYVDVGITNILTGNFDENTTNLNTNLQDVIFASFAKPGYFPPAETMGSSFFDGSVIYDLDIFSAVNKCRETHAEEDIVVDVVMTTRKSIHAVDASNYDILRIALRVGEVFRYYGVADALLRAQFAYPTINFRYVINPSRGELPKSLIPLVSKILKT